VHPLAEISPSLAATLPIAGVVLGALIAFGWNYGLKRRDEKRELRAVARLLDDELALAQQILEWKWAPYSKHRRPGLGPSPPDTVWKTHQLLLARQLDEHDWYAIAIAYLALTGLPYMGKPPDDFRAEVMTPDPTTMDEEEYALKLEFQRSREARYQEGTFEVVARARETCQRHGGVGAIERAEETGWLPKLAYLPPRGKPRSDAEPLQPGADGIDEPT
jgi:hypothetical protein